MSPMQPTPTKSLKRTNCTTTLPLFAGANTALGVLFGRQSGAARRENDLSSCEAQFDYQTELVPLLTEHALNAFNETHTHAYT